MLLEQHNLHISFTKSTHTDCTIRPPAVLPHWTVYGARYQNRGDLVLAGLESLPQRTVAVVEVNDVNFGSLRAQALHNLSQTLLNSQLQWRFVVTCPEKLQQ